MSGILTSASFTDLCIEERFEVLRPLTDAQLLEFASTYDCPYRDRPTREAYSLKVLVEVLRGRLSAANAIAEVRAQTISRLNREAEQLRQLVDWFDDDDDEDDLATAEVESMTAADVTLAEAARGSRL